MASPSGIPLLLTSPATASLDLWSRALQAAGFAIGASATDAREHDGALSVDAPFVALNQDVLWVHAADDLFPQRAARVPRDRAEQLTQLAATMTATHARWGVADARLGWLALSYLDILEDAALVAIVERPAITYRRIANAFRIRSNNTYAQVRIQRSLWAWRNEVRRCLTAFPDRVRVVHLGTHAEHARACAETLAASCPEGAQHLRDVAESLPAEYEQLLVRPLPLHVRVADRLERLRETRGVGAP